MHCFVSESDHRGDYPPCTAPTICPIRTARSAPADVVLASVFRSLPQPPPRQISSTANGSCSRDERTATGGEGSVMGALGRALSFHALLSPAGLQGQHHRPPGSLDRLPPQAGRP